MLGGLFRMLDETESEPRINVFHSRATWNICNYFVGPIDRDKRYQSPEFVINVPTATKWRFALEHERIGGPLEYLTTIFLERSASCTELIPHDVKVRFEAIFTDKKLYADFDSTFHHLSNAGVSFPLHDLYQMLRSNYSYKIDINTSGKLTITCDFLLDRAAYLAESDIDEDLKFLSYNLKDFYEKGDFKNLDLKVGLHNFSVHSAIASARSPYIASLLRENKDLREIDLTGFGSKDQIDGLIEYWYSADFNKIPRTTCSTTSNFIRKMKQDDIRPYVGLKNTVLSTTLVHRRRFVNWAIKSSEFCENFEDLFMHIFEQLPWKLQLFPKGCGIGEKENHMTLMVSEDKFSEDGVIKSVHPVYLEIFFKDCDGREHGSKKTLSWSDRNSSGAYIIENFMSLDEFRNLQGKLFEDDTCRMGCMIHYGTGSEEDVIVRDSDCETVQHPYKVLSTKMKDFLESGDMGDITLICSGKSCKVHKAVLAARSGYFRQFFFGRPCTELTLENIEPDDLKMILKYMYYAEKIYLNTELALRLYPAVRKYKVNVLDDLCSKYLQNHVTVDIAIDFIEQAHAFKDWPSKNAAGKIIEENWDQISQTKRWRQLKNDNGELASEIESRILISK